MLAEKGQVLISVTGLNDNMSYHRTVAERFKRHGLISVVHRVGWQDPAPYHQKLSRLGDTIEMFLEEGAEVSLLGICAGGSPAVASKIEYPELSKVVAVMSPFTSRDYPGYSPLSRMEKECPSFLDSVRWVEENANYLTPEMRDDIMTINVRSGDDEYPPEGSTLQGVINDIVPYDAKDHNDGITTILRTYTQPIAVFIKGQQELV